MRWTTPRVRLAIRFSALAAFLLPTSALRAQATRPSTQPAATVIIDAAASHGLRVFTAGHSFHVPIITPLAQIAAAAGLSQHVSAGRQMIGGSTVTQHWALPDDKNKAKQALRAGQVDVLTLSPYIMLPDTAIDRYTDLLLSTNPAGRVTVQASWPPRDGLLIGKFDRGQWDAADLRSVRAITGAYADRLREQVESLNAKYLKEVGRPVVFEVPVGDAVVRLRERVVKGAVPRIAKQSDLFRDDFGHGREPLYLLDAYCHYAVIYGRSPVGLSAPEFLTKAAGVGGDAAALNRVLQEVAWEAVTAEPASGVKAGTK